MSLDEEQVFNRLVDYLSTRGYNFLVDCQYESIDHPQHNILIPPNSKPDIIGLTPDDQVFAIEVKGSYDIKKGGGQASVNKRGVHKSYLAAHSESLEPHEEHVNSDIGAGTIKISESEIKWKDPPNAEVPESLPDIRSQLRYQLRNQNSIEKIASLDLAHAGNFLAPLVLVDDFFKHNFSREELIEELNRKLSTLGHESVEKVVEGAEVLNLIHTKRNVRPTKSGKVGLSVLNQENISSLDDLEDFKEKTADSTNIYEVYPEIAIWLRDQFRKHPEFEVLYRVINDFEAKEKVELTEISEVLLREYPNTFLNLFCTRKSRSKAKMALKKEEREKIYEDEEFFKDVIRQNIIQNFTRQLIHLGVLSSKTSSYNERKDNFPPSKYPWYPQHSHQTTL